MSDQPGVMGPEGFPTRDPRSKSLMNGRVLNPPRYSEFGGLDGPMKWNKAHNTSDQAGATNVIKLEEGGPTGVKGAKKTSESQKGV